MSRQGSGRGRLPGRLAVVLVAGLAGAAAQASVRLPPELEPEDVAALMQTATAPAPVPGASAGELPRAFRPPRDRPEAAALAKRRADGLRSSAPVAALALYREALLQVPDDLQAGLQAAVLAHRMDDPPLAQTLWLHLYRHALPGSLLRVLCLLQLGELQLGQGEYGTARRYQAIALTLARSLDEEQAADGSYARQLLILVLLAQADAAQALDEFAVARRAVDEALALARPHAAAAGVPVFRYPLWMALIRHGILAEAGREPQTAVRDYEESLVLARQMHEAWPEDALGAIALWTSLHKLGDLALQRGPFTAAALADIERRYLEGQRVLQGCVSAQPLREDCQRYLAIGYEHLARLARRRPDLEAARRAIEAMLALRYRLYARHPARPEVRDDLARALDMSADLYLQHNEARAAIRVLDESLALRRPLLSRSPVLASWQIGYTYSSLLRGNAAVAVNDPVTAYRHYETCQRLGRMLPGQVLALINQAGCRFQVGRLQSGRGRIDAARETQRQTLALYEQRLEQEPDSTAALADVGRLHVELGDLALAAGDADDAEREFEAALGPYRRLLVLEPNEREWRSPLAVALGKLGERLQARGDPAGAAARFEEDRALYAGLYIAPPDPPYWATNLVISIEAISSPALDNAVPKPVAERAQRLAEDVAILQRLGRVYPQDERVQRQLAITGVRLGQRAERLDDLALAGNCYAEARQRLTTMLARKPDDEALLRNRLQAAWLHGELALLRLQEPETARLAWAEHLQTARRLAALAPDAAGPLQIDIAFSLARQGEVARRAGNHAAAMQAFAESAALYRERFAQAPDTPDLAAPLTTVLVMLGGSAQQAGDGTAALYAYREAADLYPRLPPAALDAPVLRNRLMEASNQLCSLETSIGNYERARDYCRAAIELAGIGERSTPQQLDWRAWLASAWMRLGRAELQLDDLDAADAAFTASLQRVLPAGATQLYDPDGIVAGPLMTGLEGLRNARGERQGWAAALATGRSLLPLIDALIAAHPETPALQGNRMQALVSIADLLYRSGDSVGAEQAFDVYFGQARALLGETEVFPGQRRQFAGNLNNASLIASQRGDAGRAAHLAEEGLPHWRRLLIDDAGDATALQQLESTYGVLAELARQRGDAEAVRRWRAAACELYRGLLDRDPQRSDLQLKLVRAQYLDGEAAMVASDFDAASQQFWLALKRARQLAEQQPGDLVWQHEVFVGYANLGLMSARAGRPVDARAYWTQAQTLNAELLAQRDDPDWLRERTRITQGLEWLEQVAPASP